MNMYNEDTIKLESLRSIQNKGIGSILKNQQKNRSGKTGCVFAIDSKLPKICV